MTHVEIRHAMDPVSARQLDTAGLREAFHMGDLFRSGEIRLVYTHYDRMIVGGAVPAGEPLVLDEVKPTGTASILDRREMGVVNVGAAGTVSAGGESWEMGRGDVLYLPMGAGPVTFAGEGRFYILSAPAHTAHPARLVKLEDAKKVKLGSPETANERTINQFIHPEVMQSCQLVVGYTQFHGGSVWNTMPAHVHDRRMEAYLYFDLAEEARVFHFMGEPSETRHLVMKNEEAVVSPPWSIHCGCGTGSYTFVWAMAGDNVDYRDVEMVAMEDLR
ncbi:5-keto-4-deoxyuronate isomerase [Cereibacter sphaeroides]|uniref:5-dehydro-4-deoxy-D-glucuronate isomerase n=1 Tax=Cereibacter sphaeroides TaxID=1063 RepID=UPI0002A37FFB|nr:5-dehydro-4-deoxy-D-glucuronate isomerase [Cereibacter sphaeroides]AZB54750.1 5-keto-4-deoxyuronate isomerase [Cereibacter sphaeroides]AZB59016.1 5-keto-4-deoxyuronate isomerase [Cereibacter sphaeroides]EKX56049.1 4-deoxy-L-threo-5-hexosulose-uronate ketol-isomerase [Rhodobacter sp. AKP1]RHZ93185.1 5-keto-4-deoxyuronate isomerase [Cereibacter sphaeroides]